MYDKLYTSSNNRYKGVTLCPPDPLHPAPTGIDDPLPKDANQLALPVKLTNFYNENNYYLGPKSGVIETCSTDTTTGRLSMSSFDRKRVKFYFCPKCELACDDMQMLIDHMLSKHDVIVEVICKTDVEESAEDSSKEQSVRHCKLFLCLPISQAI